MLTTTQTNELESLTTCIHAQILAEHGSSADAATELAQKALHNLMAGMCNGENTTRHARVNFAAPTGFGKSTACAALLIAAYQLGLLGAGVSVVYTASRVSQLYDFESLLLDNGIPKKDTRRLVSVLHGSKVNGKDVQRASDTNLDAPILLITHERIRSVYRRAEGWQEKDLCYFLKYRGHERDLVLWDERCTTTESGSIKVDDLRQAIAGLKILYGKAPSHQALISWLITSVKTITAEGARLSAKSIDGLAEQDGALLPLLPAFDQQTFYRILLDSSRGLMRGSFDTLRDFLEALRFQPRVYPSSNSGVGVVHYKVTIPDQAARVINLDASFGVSELSQISSRQQHGLVDAEAFCPMLQEMRRLYGKRLRDLKDCSDHTLIHWQHGAGKDIVARDTEAYLNGTATGGNVILEVVDVVRQAIRAGKAAILWTHAKSHRGVDLHNALENCLRKAGIDIDTLKVQDLSEKDETKRSKPQVMVDHYGQHDAVNHYAYTQVAIHVGIMQRSEVELSGAICGESRSMTRAISHAEVRKVRTTEKAVVLQQATGRSCSRKVVDGKSLPQTTWMIYLDTEQENLTATLRPWFPQATWQVYRPVYAVEKSGGIIATWKATAKAYLEGLPVGNNCVSSTALKKVLQAETVAPRTWARLVEDMGADPQIAWGKLGRSLVRLFPEVA